MRTAFIAVAVLLATSVVAGFAVPARAGQNRDEAAIERLLKDHAAALSAFPRSRDLSAVLKRYSPGYTGVRDGVAQSLFRLKKALEEIRAEARSGTRVTIEYAVSNVRAQASGNIGWATYDFTDERSLDGLAVLSAAGRCTGVYKKRGGVWSIMHDHCSTFGREEDAEPGVAR